ACPVRRTVLLHPLGLHSSLYPHCSPSITASEGTTAPKKEPVTLCLGFSRLLPRSLTPSLSPISLYFEIMPVPLSLHLVMHPHPISFFLSLSLSLSLCCF